jgi:hypothetical protein
VCTVSRVRCGNRFVGFSSAAPSNRSDKQTSANSFASPPSLLHAWRSIRDKAAGDSAFRDIDLSSDIGETSSAFPIILYRLPSTRAINPARRDPPPPPHPHPHPRTRPSDDSARKCARMTSTTCSAEDRVSREAHRCDRRLSTRSCGEPATTTTSLIPEDVPPGERDPASISPVPCRINYGPIRQTAERVFPSSPSPAPDGETRTNSRFQAI